MNRPQTAARTDHTKQSTDAAPPLPVRWLGRVTYVPTWRAMQRFTDCA